MNLVIFFLEDLARCPNEPTRSIPQGCATFEGSSQHFCLDSSKTDFMLGAIRDCRSMGGSMAMFKTAKEWERMQKLLAGERPNHGTLQ